MSLTTTTKTKQNKKKKHKARNAHLNDVQHNHIYLRIYSNEGK